MQGFGGIIWRLMGSLGSNLRYLRVVNIVVNIKGNKIIRLLKG